MRFSIPILITAFNRPDLFEVCLKKVLDVTPETLYIAIDGPRLEREEDVKLINQIKDIIRKLVPNEVNLRVRSLERNVGAEVNISTAIDWAFVLEKELIILEDDIVVEEIFFNFMADMLKKYSLDNRIAMVSGCNFSDSYIDKNGQDYFFSKYGHTYGWATWKNRWAAFDLNVVVSLGFLDMVRMLKHMDTIDQALFHFRKFNGMRRRGVGNSSWDACWSYLMRSQGWLAIVPARNIASNIGIFGLHSNGPTYHNKAIASSYTWDSVPKKIVRNTDYDKFHFNNHFKTSAGALRNLLLLLTNR